MSPELSDLSKTAALMWDFAASATAEALKPQWEKNVDQVWEKNKEVKVALYQEVSEIAKQSSIGFYFQGMKQDGVLSVISKQITGIALMAFGALAFCAGFSSPGHKKANFAVFAGPMLMLGGSSVLYDTNKGYVDDGIKASIAAAVDKHTGNHLSAEDRLQLTQKLFLERNL